MNSLGLDIGATKIRYLIWDNRRSKILVNREIRYKERTRKDFLRTLRRISVSLKKEGFYFDKIGIANAGIVDKTGRLVYSPNYPAILNLNLRKAAKNILGKSPLIDNDANAFALAEAIAGAAKKYKYVVGLTLGTGLGGGIVFNKKLYRGKAGGAGEIGRLKLGNGKEAEDIGSSKFFQSKSIQNHSALELKARAGQTKARIIYKEFGENLGFIIANVINILDPEVIVLGGGISRAYDLFIEPTLVSAKKLIANPLSRNTPILKSKFGESSGALGAALL